MIVLPPLAEVKMGKFWRLLAPVSPSPASLGVTPSPPRSIPQPALENMEFDRMAFPVPEVTNTPRSPLKAMVLPAPPAVPPMGLLDTPSSQTPYLGFPRMAVPVVSG